MLGELISILMLFSFAPLSRNIKDFVEGTRVSFKIVVFSLPNAIGFDVSTMQIGIINV